MADTGTDTPAELVHLEVDGAVATITLDSPHNRNALSRQLVSELFERLEAAEGDDAVRAVVVRSSGRVFCSGADLHAIAAGAVQHIAEAELGHIPGVVATGSGLDRVVGRQYPKVTADVAGSRAKLGVEIAVVWPLPLAQVCGQVRDTLRNRVGELTGLGIDAVDVTAAKVVQPVAQVRRRVE